MSDGGGGQRVVGRMWGVAHRAEVRRGGAGGLRAGWEALGSWP